MTLPLTKNALLEIHHRLSRLHESLPGHFYRPGDQSEVIAAIGAYNGTMPVAKAHAELCDKTAIVDGYTLADMPRWLTILFPKDASQDSGAFGISVRISDLLRWAVEDDSGSLPEYAMALSNALELTEVPRPTVADPSAEHLSTLEAYLEVVGLCEEDPDFISNDGKLELLRRTRDALYFVEFGHQEAYPTFSYPIDMLPLAKADGGVSMGMSFGVEGILRNVLKRADYVDDIERAQIHRALAFFPDPDLDLEVTLEDHQTYRVTDPSVFRVFHSPVPYHLMLPSEGSVDLDHYGDEPRFSTVAGDLELNFHRVAAHLDVDDEYLDCCFLVSDRVVYTACIEQV